MEPETPRAAGVLAPYASRSTLFATVGFTPRTVLAPLRQHPGLRRLVAFYGPPSQAEAKAAMRKVRTACEALGVELLAHPVSDAFDYLDLLEVMDAALDDHDPQDVLFNAAGGTRVMGMAATVFCLSREVPMLYYDEHGNEEGKLIPLKAYTSLPALKGTKRRILQELKATGRTDMGTLAERIGIAPSTLTVHVQRLEEAGAVRTEQEGKHRFVSLEPDLERMDLEVGA